MTSRKMPSFVVAVALTLGMAATANSAQAQVPQLNFGNLISALNNISVILDDVNLDLIDDITVGDVDVTVVDASNLLRGSNIRALNNALNRNNVEILNLRNVLNDLNIEDVLNDLDIDVLVDDVIGVDLIDGVLVLFTR